MCCFSKPVEYVADTNIFARAAKNGGQFLVYSMRFQAGEDLAMILPIPTPKASAEDAVKFLNLEKYESFFDDMQKGFPVPAANKDGRPLAGGLGGVLPVVEVGKYEASFVPAIKDFARLDARFRLPMSIWDKLPQYAEFGFAVFKLTKPKEDVQKVHPMAFEFPRAIKDMLFFPTVHIHDGSVPAKAEFDHSLFCQVEGEAPLKWEESPGLADSFMKVKETQGIIEGNAHVYKKVMKGKFENRDVAV